MKKIFKILKNPKLVLFFLENKGFFDFLSDERYLKLFYRLRVGKKLNLKKPETFNEKLQWLKLNDRKDIYTKMVDKYETKKYVANLIGEEYTIPTLGVWDSFDEIDFESLPNQFVLKCTHDSGGLVICKDKSRLDTKKVKFKINRSLRKNYFYHGREWPYKNVKPRIIAEKYVEDSLSENLVVYKFMTFNGEVKIIQNIQNDKTNKETIDYFDVDWKVLPLKQNFPNSENPLEKPKTYQKMLDIVKILSHNLPFLRVDLYEVNEKVLFSEFTFYSDSGFAKFYPEEWDGKLGDCIKLK